MKPSIIIVLIVVIVSLFFFLNRSPERIELGLDGGNDGEKVEDVMTMMKDKGRSPDEMIMEMDDEMMKTIMEVVFAYSGALKDVTGGDNVRGINTSGNSTGLAKAGFTDSRYNLLVTFENLPDPAGDDFYEGWIVRKGLKFDVISSGPLEKVDGVYINTYASGQDLTDHDFYVLTLEPNDGNPAPADHILEGTMVKNGN